MTNWLENLEEEERRDSSKRIILDEIRAKSEDSLKNSLVPFFQLCNRVSKVKNSILKVRELEVTGDSIILNYPYSNENGYTNGHKLFRYVKFDLDSIEVFTSVCEYSDLSNKIFIYETGHTNFILFRNRIAIQSINNWEEEKILNLIKWLLFDYDNDSVIEYLPGEEIYNYNTKKYSLLEDLKEANSKLNQIQQWQFGRSSYEKYGEVNNQKDRIKKIQNELAPYSFFSQNRK